LEHGLKLLNKNFVDDAKKVHGDKYDYSKVEYKGNKVKVCISCPKHGEFWQAPNHHLKGHGCQKCAVEKRSQDRARSKEEFIQLSREIYGTKYDYSKVEYKNAMTKVCIACPKHGDFWQIPMSHLRGHGCPCCVRSKLEENTEAELKKYNVNYIPHCNRSFIPWIGYQHLYFYLPEYNIAIECQGEQHYRPVKIFGGEERFSYRQKMDENKKNLCQKNGVFIHYIKFDEDVSLKVKEILSLCHS
jgi:hypothetical protein